MTSFATSELIKLHLLSRDESVSARNKSRPVLFQKSNLHGVEGIYLECILRPVASTVASHAQHSQLCQIYIDFFFTAQGEHEFIWNNIK